MSPHARPPIPALLRTVFVTAGTLAVLGSGAAAADAAPAAHHHHNHQVHHSHPGHHAWHHGGHRPGRPTLRSMPRLFQRSAETAIHFALAHLGDRYVFGANGPHRWDCSALVQQAYRRAGVRLPRVAAAQYRAAVPIRRSQLRRGDLVFWTTNGRSSGIHHVAVYIGRGRYVEAPSPGRRVQVSSFARARPTMYARV